MTTCFDFVWVIFRPFELFGNKFQWPEDDSWVETCSHMKIIIIHIVAIDCHFLSFIFSIIIGNRMKYSSLGGELLDQQATNEIWGRTYRLMWDVIQYAKTKYAETRYTSVHNHKYNYYNPHETYSGVMKYHESITVYYTLCKRYGLTLWRRNFLLNFSTHCI
jgi:hypothetical protein